MKTIPFLNASAWIDAENEADPNNEIYQEVTYPKNYYTPIECTKGLWILSPDASEAVQIAAKAQTFAVGK